jgi:hypothetical protein
MGYIHQILTRLVVLNRLMQNSVGIRVNISKNDILIKHKDSIILGSA